VKWRGGAECEGFEYNSATHRYRVQFATEAGAVVEDSDQVIVVCGFGPDTALHRELRVHESFETLAPAKVAEALRAAGTGDCAKVPEFDAATFATQEPGFYILGAKSYGRSSAFLLETGYRHVAGVLAALAEAAGLRAPQEA